MGSKGVWTNSSTTDSLMDVHDEFLLEGLALLLLDRNSDLSDQTWN